MKFYLSICLQFVCLACCFCQQVAQGKIIDSQTKEPLIGVSIQMKGTTSGTQTDWDGFFNFETDQSYPFELLVSYTGYKQSNILVENAESITLQMDEESIVIEGVEVKGQRISDKQKSSPLTVESMDLIAIKETASSNFYDGLGTLKDVDLTTASLGFTIVNTRGFNSTSPVRSLQIIDGVDNQSPGLNFSLGNFLGSAELDINKVDLIVGASSGVLRSKCI